AKQGQREDYSQGDVKGDTYEKDGEKEKQKRVTNEIKIKMQHCRETSEQLLLSDSALPPAPKQWFLLSA
ncbi:hypothetical protein NDU88_003411, partial [Pleurodeles waltl]